MSLHNDKPNADRLDGLARGVLNRAIEFERRHAEEAAAQAAGAYRAAAAGAVADPVPLCEAVKAYREALVAELIGNDGTSPDVPNLNVVAPPFVTSERGA